MVAGGSEAWLDPASSSPAFAAMQRSRRRNDAPEKASRPFDKDRDGFVLSEGAAVVVLEEREHAQARGARIYGELVGYGATADAYHITAPSPEGEGNARAMRMALEEAGLAPDGDRLHQRPRHLDPAQRPRGDRGDQAGLRRARLQARGLLDQVDDRAPARRGRRRSRPSSASWPSATAASRRPSTTRPPTPICDLDYVPNTARAKTITTALSNSMGFGGHNASLIFAKG